MSSAYRELSERIHGEVADLDLLVSRVARGWKSVESGGDDQDMFLDSVALNLHAFYSGLESLFELTVKNIDGVLPTGEDWHRALLAQVAAEREGMRPAIVNAAHLAGLDELRRFRHLVRNVYAFNLIPSRMEKLATSLPALWKNLRSELIAFADLLSEIADEEESGQTARD